MSLKNQVKHLFSALGIVILAFGFFVSANYAFRMNGDRDWGTNSLLFDLGFIAFGIAFQLLGLGLITLGKT